MMSQKNICAQCNGEGFYYRLPSGMNPFASSIEVTAREMKRIKCECSAVPPADGKRP